jgi:uncharacterized protein (DUF427 family)
MHQLYNPEGIFLVGDAVYVADYQNHRVMKYTPPAGSTVRQLRPEPFGSSGYGTHQFYYPRGAAVDADGSSVIADYHNHRVMKWTQGAAAGEIVAGGNGAGSELHQLSYPCAVAVYSGAYYVADRSNNRIVRWAYGATAGAVVSGIGYSGGDFLYNPQGVHVRNDGVILASSEGTNRVFSFTPTGTYRNPTVAAGGLGSGSELSKLATPHGVDVGDEGDIFVADTYNHRVLKFSSGSTEGIVVAGITGDDCSGDTNSQCTELEKLYYPYDVSVVGNDTVYVVGQSLVTRWDAGATAGVVVAGNNGCGSSLNQLCTPVGVEAMADGTVYIADKNNHRVTKWIAGAAEGEIVAGGNGAGSGLNQVYHAYGVAVAANGDVFVADYHNHRVVKWTPGAAEGVIVAGGNGAGNGDDQLYHPFDVDIAPDGTLYIADLHRIVAVPPGKAARHVAGLGAGSRLDQFQSPQRVAIHVGGIYVADTNNHRIMQWADSESEGYLQVEVDVVAGVPFGAEQRRRFHGSGAHQLYGPLGITTSANGTLLVADYYNHRVVEWAPGATEGVVVAGGIGAGHSLEHFYYPKDVDADSEGFVVADYSNHRIRAVGTGVVTVPAPTQTPGI